MRWNEIFLEFDTGMTSDATGFVLDLLAPLRAQGVSSVTTQQIIDHCNGNPDFEGINLDDEFVMAALEGQPNIRIETDPENGAMTVFLDDVAKSRQVDHQQAEQEKERVRQAAVRQATKDKK